MGEEVWIAFLLTLMAGLATGIGSLIAFFYVDDKHEVPFVGVRV